MIIDYIRHSAINYGRVVNKKYLKVCVGYLLINYAISVTKIIHIIARASLGTVLQKAYLSWMKSEPSKLTR